MKIVPLGDQAVMVDCGSEQTAARLAESARRSNESWLVDVVLAYASTGIFFDPNQIAFAGVQSWINNLPLRETVAGISRDVIISCCYQMGPDLVHVAHCMNLKTADVIELHSSAKYTVYAIGFCPGFPYLGYLPIELAGLPRLDTPRLQVEPGSIGITGRQTGIYPLPRPGGWNLIGRTPLQLVDLETAYFALAPGDRVRFEPINQRSFKKQIGRRPAAIT